jgi:hypothetical protein
MKETWVIFGDDWGRHPSTTQHLLRAFPQNQRLIWFNSIGMRAPQWQRGDVFRILGRFRNRNAARSPEDGGKGVKPLGPEVISLPFLPLHGSQAARAVNRALLRRIWSQLDPPGSESGIQVVFSNPLALHYLDAIRCTQAVYLRLDDYARLPGVNPDWVKEAEEEIARRRLPVFGTAPSLLHAFDLSPTFHLPQGVDVDHFGLCTETPPPQKVVGFFGLLAPWVNHDLVEAAAQAHPDWTFEFVGKKEAWPQRLHQLSNVHLKGPVDYPLLPQAISHWRAAWLPFEENELTRHVDPLKLREYLAAGLPTFSTPLPGSRVPAGWAQMGKGVDAFTRFLAEALKDTPEKRRRRKDAMIGESWRGRAEVFRKKVRGLAGNGTVVSNQVSA